MHKVELRYMPITCLWSVWINGKWVYQSEIRSEAETYYFHMKKQLKSPSL